MLRENAHLRVFLSHSFAGAAIDAISPDETWAGGTLTVSF